MKFIIDYTGFIDHSKRLTYDTDEFSFNTEPSIQEINFDVVINKLSLSAVDGDNKIVQLRGFCGYKEWQKSNFEPPHYKTGTLKVAGNIEGGFSYRVAKMICQCLLMSKVAGYVLEAQKRTVMLLSL
ncbi:hypothetical protein [Sphingobacterium sp. FBM7-1]|uniref:hypothetical protein n=1 Tax=Sphingobacterium sp. FBM7-1 TaxID=2886688 RepID=UPI001D0FFB29|nr:hypothetical protein [Sphingobacterium sp. FBM7-1]MCC2597915.1 hypothetical protein [Sphingobacterium sp. FBM7-1]